MKRSNIGLIGYGTVGCGVVKLLKARRSHIKNKFKTEFVLRTLCDRSIHKKNTRGLGKTRLTKKIQDILNDPKIDIVIELIGGMHPAREIALKALRSGKHVVTANKELIANCGKELFQLARKNHCHLYFESSVGAGIPIIKNITEGVVGNKFNSIYCIINGTCHFILRYIAHTTYSFTQALQAAQETRFAESNPSLDINGTDSVHKLAILIYLAFGKSISVKDIYREGITHISRVDIEYATSLGIKIKLIAIEKKEGKKIEVKNKIAGIVRLDWTRLYTGSEDDYFHALTMPDDGSLIRVRITPPSDSRKLYRQRVADPTPQSDFSQWTYSNQYNAVIATCCSLGSEVSIFWIKSDRAIYRIKSTDYGATFGSPELIDYSPTTAIYGIAAAYKPNGDLALFFADQVTLYVKKHVSGNCQNNAACDKTTVE